MVPDNPINIFSNWTPRIEFSKAISSANKRASGDQTDDDAKPITLPRSHEDMMILAYKKPHLCATEIYDALSLSGYMGVKIKKALICAGMVSEVQLPSNKRGRRKTLLNILPKATKYLASLGVKGGRKGRGGVSHIYYQEMLRRWYVHHGYTVEIEARVGNVSLDLLAIDSKGDRIGIEIELNFSNKFASPENSNADALGGVEVLIFVCESPELLEKVKQAIGKIQILWNKTRVAFKLISEYNLEELQAI